MDARGMGWADACIPPRPPPSEPTQAQVNVIHALLMPCVYLLRMNRHQLRVVASAGRRKPGRMRRGAMTATKRTQRTGTRIIGCHCRRASRIVIQQGPWPPRLHHPTRQKRNKSSGTVCFSANPLFNNPQRTAPALFVLAVSFARVGVSGERGNWIQGELRNKAQDHEPESASWEPL